MESIKKIAEFHLETMRRSLKTDTKEKAVACNSQLPGTLKIRLDLCAEFLDMTRNGLMIEILQAVIPDLEEVIRAAQMKLSQTSVAGSFDQLTYDQAVEAFNREFERTGKAPNSMVGVNELLIEAGRQFDETGKVTDELRGQLEELGLEMLVRKGDQ